MSFATRASSVVILHLISLISGIFGFTFVFWERSGDMFVFTYIYFSFL